MTINTYYQNKKSILQRRSAYAFIAVVCLICINALFINTGLQLQRNMLLITETAFKQQILLRDTGDKISQLIKLSLQPALNEKVINQLKENIGSQRLEINKNHELLLEIYSPDNITLEHYLMLLLVDDQTEKLKGLSYFIKNINQRIRIILSGDNIALVTGHRFWSPPDLTRLDNAGVAKAMQELTTNIYLASSKQNKTLTLLYATLLIITSTGILLIWHIAFRPLEKQLKIQNKKIQNAYEKLHEQIHIDPLTGLKNRSRFNLDINEQLCNTEPGTPGLLLIDIDGFKAINDAYGHNSGDEVLVQSANRLKSFESQYITAYRFGGDEFILLSVNKPGRQSLDNLGKQICEAFYQPFTVSGGKIPLSASIGISWRAHSMQSLSSKELLRAADIALSHVKQRGKNNYLFYDQANTTDIGKLVDTETRLFEAVQENEIIPYYQPIVDLGDKKILYLEALARWEHPERGTLTPEHWLGLADQALLSRMTKNMSEQIIRDIDLFTKSGLDHVCININTTESMLVQGVTLQIAREVIRRFGYPAKIGIEITETVFFERSSVIIQEQLRLIRKEGVKLFLDDFGTGYASLMHLKDFPVDAIKVDKNFIKGLPKNSDKVIIQAILTLANGLNKQLICEGVETEEARSILIEMGCQYGQGFLFSKALSAGELLNTYHSKQSVQTPAC